MPQEYEVDLESESCGFKDPPPDCEGTVSSDENSSLNTAAGMSRIGVFSGSFIMLNTVVGGGISLVATPFAARCLGLFPFLIIESILACCTAMCLYSLADISSRTCRYSFMSLCDKYIGRWASVLIAAAVVIGNIAVCTAFFQVAFDVLDALLPSAPSWMTPIVVGGCALIMVPATSAAHVSNVELLAAPVTMLWMGFVLMVFINFGLGVRNDNLSHTWEWDTPKMDVLFGKGIPAINLSWTCQFNAPPLFASLRREDASSSKTAMRRVGFSMASSAMVLYMMLGVAAYVYYGASLQDDIMESIDSSKGGKGLEWGRPAVVVVEALLGVCVIVSMPFFLIEARNMGHKAVTGKRNASKLVRVLEAASLKGTAFIIAYSARGHLSTVIALVGILPSNIIAWGMPGLLAVCVHRRYPDMPWYTSVVGYAMLLIMCVTTTLGGVSLFTSYGAEAETH